MNRCSASEGVPRLLEAAVVPEPVVEYHRLLCFVLPHQAVCLVPGSIATRMCTSMLMIASISTGVQPRNRAMTLLWQR